MTVLVFFFFLNIYLTDSGFSRSMLHLLVVACKLSVAARGI